MVLVPDKLLPAPTVSSRHMADDPDTVILYEYQIGESRDRSHKEYLVVFKSVGERYEPTKSRLVGIGGIQHLKEINIDGMTIILRGMGFSSKDAACCPSEAISVQYVVVDEELVAKGYRIKQCP